MLLFVFHELWSIIDDSGFVVSSVVSSHPALLAFHMLAGNLDRALMEGNGDFCFEEFFLLFRGWHTTFIVSKLIIEVK